MSVCLAGMLSSAGARTGGCGVCPEATGAMHGGGGAQIPARGSIPSPCRPRIPLHGGSDARWQCADGLLASPSAPGLPERPVPVGAAHCQPRSPTGRRGGCGSRAGRTETLLGKGLESPGPAFGAPQSSVFPKGCVPRSSVPLMLTPVVCRGGGQGRTRPNTRLDKSSWALGKGVPCQSPPRQVSCPVSGSARCPATAQGANQGMRPIPRGPIPGHQDPLLGTGTLFPGYGTLS